MNNTEIIMTRSIELGNASIMLFHKKDTIEMTAWVNGAGLDGTYTMNKDQAIKLAENLIDWAKTIK